MHSRPSDSGRLNGVCVRAPSGRRMHSQNKTDTGWNVSFDWRWCARLGIGEMECSTHTAANSGDKLCPLKTEAHPLCVHTCCLSYAFLRSAPLEPYADVYSQPKSRLNHYFLAFHKTFFSIGNFFKTWITLAKRPYGIRVSNETAIIQWIKSTTCETLAVTVGNEIHAIFFHFKFQHLFSPIVWLTYFGMYDVLKYAVRVFFDRFSSEKNSWMTKSSRPQMIYILNWLCHSLFAQLMIRNTGDHLFNSFSSCSGILALSMCRYGHMIAGATKYLCPKMYIYTKCTIFGTFGFVHVALRPSQACVSLYCMRALITVVASKQRNR